MAHYMDPADGVPMTGLQKYRWKQRLRGKIIRAENGCWLWTSSRHGNGYGLIRTCKKGKRKNHLAHRIVYLAYGGVIPKGFVLRHKCDNKLCVNPEHLVPGTNQENVQDSVERGLWNK